MQRRTMSGHQSTASPGPMDATASLAVLIYQVTSSDPWLSPGPTPRLHLSRSTLTLLTTTATTTPGAQFVPIHGTRSPSGPQVPAQASTPTSTASLPRLRVLDRNAPSLPVWLSVLTSAAVAGRRRVLSLLATPDLWYVAHSLNLLCILVL